VRNILTSVPSKKEKLPLSVTHPELAKEADGLNCKDFIRGLGEVTEFLCDNSKVKSIRLIAVFITLATVFSASVSYGATPKISFNYGDTNYFTYKGKPNNLDKACKKLSTIATYDYLGQSNNCALIWSSNTPLSGRIFLQVFENGTWIKISKSKRFDSNELNDFEKNGISVKKKINSQQGMYFNLKTLTSPRNEEAVKLQNSRIATGELCWAQDAGPLGFRVLFESTTGVSLYSNEVRISYKNFENIRYDGFQCSPTKVTPQGAPSKTQGAKLPACTISEVIDLKNYILKRNDAYELEKSSLLNIRVQQDVYGRALSAQARADADASIDKWTRLLQQAAGVVRQFELLFGDIKNRCSADDVLLPALAPIE